MPSPRLAAVVIDDAVALSSFAERWDALAVRCSRPYMAPAVQLAWWAHARTGDARLRCVVVLDGDDLVGIAPMFAQVSALRLAEYRFLGAGNFHRLEPLAAPGREREVARLIAERLATVDPAPSSIVCEGFDADSPWPGLLRHAWPGRMQLRTDQVMPAPVILLEPDFDAWLRDRNKGFREKLRSRRRRFAKAGATWRLSTTPEEVTADLAALYRMHHARWSSRGGSAALTPRMERTLSAVGPALVAKGRFRLWTMEVDGEVIAASLFVSAGKDVAYWGGGMAPAWERESPGVQLVQVEVEAAFARGVERLDLGGGEQDYKRRFTGHVVPLTWQTLFPLGPRWPLTRLQLAPKHLRGNARALARRMPPERQAQLKRVLRR